MSARHETESLISSIERRTQVRLSFDDANTLRRAEKLLQRWAELECGDSNQWGSWAIERDDNGDGAPFMVHHRYAHGTGKDSIVRTRIADREAGALRRIKAVCERNGLNYYHQTDPRGCALYVSNQPFADFNYSSVGVACCVR